MSRTYLDELIQTLQQRTAKIAVIGLGYVGLPFAVEQAKNGFQVIGIERNAKRVQMVNDGMNYISDVSDEIFQDVVEKGLLSATTDFDAVADADVAVICVPTPLTVNLTPDLQYVQHVAEELAKRLRVKQLISLESTTYPGTTAEVILPLLAASGLKPDVDFFLAHSPERVDPGNPRYKTKNTPKVVGGIGPQSLEAAVTFYGQAIDTVVPVSNSQVAEMSKVFENTFRAVNIALVNELAMLCDRMNLNVWEVLDASFTKPFGIMPFYPGPGVGGHCIPIDPHYLEWKAKEVNFYTHFIALAGEINRSMPEFVFSKALRMLTQQGINPSQARVLVLGVAYKKNVADYRESPALPLMQQFLSWGMDVSYYDPWLPTVPLENGQVLSSAEVLSDAVLQSDLIILVTDHDDVDYPWVLNHAKLIFDTRNVLKAHHHGSENVAGKVTVL